MEKLTKEEKVINYLKRYGKITPLEALKECGSYRLSAVIFNLKKKGYSFETKRVRVRTRDGWSYVAEYKLMGRWLGLRG